MGGLVGGVLGSSPIEGQNPLTKKMYILCVIVGALTNISRKHFSFTILRLTVFFTRS